MFYAYFRISLENGHTLDTFLSYTILQIVDELTISPPHKKIAESFGFDRSFSAVWIELRVKGFYLKYFGGGDIMMVVKIV